MSIFAVLIHLKNTTMKKFIIERTLPGAGNLTAAELKAIAQTSCDVIQQMEPGSYQWLESYITNDKIYCVHIANNEEAVRQHARMGNFPVNSVNEVKTIIDPLTSVSAG